MVLEPETYFCALYNNGTESTTPSLFADTNGILGIVSAQLRKRAHLVAGPSINNKMIRLRLIMCIHHQSHFIPIYHTYTLPIWDQNAT